MDHTPENFAKIELMLQRDDKLFEKLTSSVRGPLYSIMELARIAREDGLSSAITLDYIKTIEMSGRIINEAVNDIMALRNVYMNDVYVIPQRMYIVDLVNGLKAELEKSIGSGNTSFEVTDKSMMDTAILADYNVIQNTTRKLAKSLVNVTLQPRNIRFVTDKVGETDDSITLKFSMFFDDYSFTSTQIECLTAPFDKFVKTVERDEEITNSTFIIIRYYLHAMGTDKVEINESEDGSVSVSTQITFPKIDKKEVLRLDMSAIDFTGKRILVADDDSVNLIVMEKLLRSKNADFVTVRDGKEALHTFRNEHGRFDLIIIDIIMPDMSGLEVAKQIRNTTTIPNARTVPIMAMTANALYEHYFESRKAGMNAHLVKPINPISLYATIARLLNEQTS